jgi:rubrerythrin
VAKNFKDLSEHEILALAISSEETDARIYADFAEGLKVDYRATSQIFKGNED